MRAGFIRALTDLARDDENIFLLVGDVGYSLVEPFRREFPDRFINIGIAEQNMTGIAAGLAVSGKTVFVYSLANFPTLRCLEQIRNDVCYHDAGVKIVAAGGGLVYGTLGVSHHVTEDLAVMSALPGMTVIAPGDPVEAELATRAAAGLPGPCYLRLARTGDPVIHQSAPDFRVGQAIRVREGDDITLIATGGILDNAVRAAGQLERRGIQARVLSMHTVKPLDAAAVLAAARETGAIITVEEHSVIGGLGSAVAAVLAESAGLNTVFKRMGIQDVFCAEIGSQAYLQKVCGLAAEDIGAEAVRLVKGASGKA